MSSASLEKNGTSLSRQSSDEFHNEKLEDKGAFADTAILERDLQALSSDIEEAMIEAEKMSPEEVDEYIHEIIHEHGNDPNFPARVMNNARLYAEDSTVQENLAEKRRLYDELKVEAALIKINSAYEEVRAVVDNHDDPSIPANTFRAWFIGILYVGAGAFINQFFSIRQPGIGVDSNVAQLLAFPAGKLLERILPTRKFTTFGHTWSLNPGPFNMKEHMVITIMANVGFTAPYTSYVVFVQYVDLFFGMKWASNFGYQILISLSTNFIGYGLAGLTRRFLVYPAYAIWPSNLACIALNRAFHTDMNVVANGWAVSRMRYFLYCFVGMFVYFWFPDYIFAALSYFNWMVWIAPDNVNLAAITGSVSGLGLNPLPTFDWNQLTVVGDPLINPFFTMMNLLLGALITLPVVAAVWYNNVFNTAYLPINSNGVFDNTGSRYMVQNAINADGLFDEAAYQSYSPAYLTAANVVIYGVFFACYTATISHVILYHRFEIVSGFKNIFKKNLDGSKHIDVHSRLMRSYKEVPEWWFFLILLASIATGAAGVGAWPTHTSPAVVLYGVFLAFIFCIPIGIIQAVTNVQIGLNVLAELFGGLWFTGNANAVNFFKTYGFITTTQTLAFAQDMKLAHYIHIPPRVTFACQSIATLVSTFVCVAIMNFQMTQIDNVCSPDQKNDFTCPGQNTFFTASVLWGTLGPNRMFGEHKIYNGLLWCFLIGFALPIIFYFIGSKYPAFRKVHFPVLFYGGLVWSPYNLSNIWPAIPVGYVFNVYIKHRYIAWWSKYNYITSTAFSTAIAISAIVIFFALQWTNVEINWSGNNRPFENCDGMACSLYLLGPNQTFGPVVGEF